MVTCYHHGLYTCLSAYRHGLCRLWARRVGHSDKPCKRVFYITCKAILGDVSAIGKGKPQNSEPLFCHLLSGPFVKRSISTAIPKYYVRSALYHHTIAVFKTMYRCHALGLRGKGLLLYTGIFLRRVFLHPTGYRITQQSVFGR